MVGINDRRKYILDSMVRKGYLKVAELSETLGVTQTTIRKDLTYLEKKGLLYRAYGSALPTAPQVLDIALDNKKLINYEEKQRIGAAAAAMLEENDSIIISSGSTTAVFVDCIKVKGRLNVVSTAVNVSQKLSETKGVSVMQVGGMLYSNTLSVTGEDAIKTLSNVYCHKMFFGADGFDPDYGMTCGSMEEAENCRILVHAEQLLLRRSEYLRAPEELLKILSEEGGPEILCADEIGLGIVPADAGERAWRDAAGSFSQAAARRASSVYRIICGIPVCLKKEAGEDGDE